MDFLALPEVAQADSTELGVHFFPGDLRDLGTNLGVYVTSTRHTQ